MNRKQRRAAAKSGQTAGKLARDAAALRTDIAGWLREGVQYQQAGRLAEAEACYRRVLATQPDNPDAFYLLGCIALRVRRTGLAAELIAEAIKRDRHNPLYYSELGNALQELKRFEEALASYGKALALKPDYAEAFNNRGAALYELRRFEEALASYGKALALKPDYAFAFHNRGNALQALRRFEEALASYDRALALKPDYAEAFHNRGLGLYELRRFEEALASYDRALALKPDYAEAFHNHGLALYELGRFDEAVASYDRVLALKPDYAEAFHNHGLALYELRRFEEALASCDRALLVKPDFAEALCNRGNAALGLKRFEEALISYDRALALKPDYAEAFHNRGAALHELRRFEEALASYGKALALKPDYAEAFHNRGVALDKLRRLDEALASYGKALALRPDHAEALSGAMGCANSLCDWGRKAALADDAIAQISDRGSYVSPFNLLGYSGDPSLQLQCAGNYAASLFPSLPRPMCSRTAWRNDRLRIAYLSAHFHQHAVGDLMAGLFELHDRSRFEVIAMSFGADDGSAMRRRIAGAFDRFIDIRQMSDEAAAKLLYDLKADIAIDVMGYNQDCRPRILAYRPAPVQAAYLDHPGTTGAPFIDYIIADSTVAPFEHQHFYSEKIVQLPNCFQVNDGKRQIAEHTSSRQEAGLPGQGFVFCCFNQNWKIAPDVFDVWMRLMHAVHDSVLWLKRDFDAAERNLRKEAEARGIDPARLIFAPRLPSAAEHLARHRLADLFLDTLPFNAHTTASDALWAGLPVLTQLGQAFAGRVAASLLHAVGLPELVTHSLAEYEVLALRLAREPELLAGYRERLSTNRLSYPLFDTERFRCHIETAYLEMREICERGEPPRCFKVEAEGVCTPA